jgi:hypothetical protein
MRESHEKEQKRSVCLRAVMLGYLKTNEIVVGDNCYSCSRCVQTSSFLQISSCANLLFNHYYRKL